MYLPRTKPFEKLLTLEAYKSTRKVLFKSTAQAEASNNQGVEIPIAIVYRLYYIGRAYDFQAIKLLQPKGKTMIPYIESQRLISELEMLYEIVKDPVVEHYLKILLPYIESKREYTNGGILVSED